MRFSWLKPGRAGRHRRDYRRFDYSSAYGILYIYEVHIVYCTFMRYLWYYIFLSYEAPMSFNNHLRISLNTNFYVTWYFLIPPPLIFSVSRNNSLPNPHLAPRKIHLPMGSQRGLQCPMCGRTRGKIFSSWEMKIHIQFFDQFFSHQLARTEKQFVKPNLSNTFKAYNKAPNSNQCIGID